MIHSIIPLDVIFDNPSANHQEQATMICQVQGMQLEVKPLDFSRGQIVKIINGPLEAYLNPKYCPGAVIVLPSE